eukprot:COSAG01_NODE_33812_length_558_cov_0.871460_2_plen_35_part_01
MALKTLVQIAMPKAEADISNIEVTRTRLGEQSDRF